MNICKVKTLAFYLKGDVVYSYLIEEEKNEHLHSRFILIGLKKNPRLLLCYVY